MIEPGHHLLVVEEDYDRERSPDPALDAEFAREDMRVHLVCTGVDANCRAWFECTDTDHFHPDPNDLGYDDFEDGGEEHRWIMGSWMTPTNDCLGIMEGGETVHEVLYDLGHIPGVYRVEIEWDEGTYVLLDNGRDDSAVPDDLVEYALSNTPVNPCPRCGSHEIAANHNPCCSSHKRPLCHHCYSLTHFVETGCCGPQYAPAPPRRPTTEAVPQA